MHIQPFDRAVLPPATVAALHRVTRQQLHEVHTNLNEIRRQLTCVQVGHGQLFTWTKVLTYGAVGGGILLAGWFIVPWAIGAATTSATAFAAAPALCTAATCMKSATPIITAAVAP